MKIVRESANHHFSDVKPGIVFTRRGNFYMAIESIIEYKSGIELNAVHLETGELVHLFDTDSIQLVEAKLHVI